MPRRFILVLPFIFIFYLNNSFAVVAEDKNVSPLNEFTQKLPAGIKPLVFVDGTKVDSVKISGDITTTKQTISDAEGRFSEFLRIKVTQKGKKSYDVTAHSIRNTADISKDDWVVASFYVRASPGTGSVNLRGFIERTEPAWMMVADASIATGEQWTRVVALGRAPVDLPKNSTHLSLHLAMQAQSMDIAGLTYLSLPANTPMHVFPPTELRYSGMDSDAPWREKAEQMIKDHRSDTFKIFVLDRSGKALDKQTLEVEQLDLDYSLGSMVGPLYIDETEQGQRYERWFNQFFNAATARIYWADWGWEDPDIRNRYLTSMAKLKHNDVDARGHVLLYPAFRFSPASLNVLADNKEAFINRVNQHIDEMVPILKANKINEYDVINELRDEAEWLDIVGLDTVVDWFKRVHQLHPEAILYINENSILTDGGENTEKQDHYYETISYLLEQGAPIHGIGMQGHFSGVVTPIEKMWEILDRFAKFGLPVKITEYDSNTRDVEAQAQFDTDFYQAIYAHPITVGITRWGFYEPKMWRPLGALVDANDELKPNATAYLDWLNTLKDNKQRLSTDSAGAATFKGLYGKYKVSLKQKNEVHYCVFNEPLIATNASDITVDPSCTVRLND